MARWGLKTPGKQLTTVIPVSRILVNKPYNLMIRQSRCAVPCNCFFGMRNDEPYLIRLIKQRLFSLGGIYSVNAKSEHAEYRFALLTVKPADLLQSLLDEMPLVLGHDRHQSWLDRSHVDHIMYLADRSGSYWFDYFQLAHGFFTSHKNTPGQLAPIRGSYMQYQREQELKRIAYLEENRVDRNGAKY